MHSPGRMKEDMAGVLARPARIPSELGWARIVMHHQGDMNAAMAPVFEGAFTVNGVTYNVVTKHNYLRHKHPLDSAIPPADDLDSELVIWRDSDMMSALEEEQAVHNNNKAGLLHNSVLPLSRPQTCGHDTLLYNTDPRLNPALQKPVSPYDPFGFFNALDRRDDIVGSSSGSK
jgi:hypothetical protein